MDYKYIDQLLNRYFDGTTTIAEERILKAFFSQDDVPAHLNRYAQLFQYEETDAQATPLADDFDQRILARLEADGDAPVLHVRIQRLTFADRFRPLMRSAAAVAIFALLGGSIHHAYVSHPVEPITNGYGEGSIEQAEGTTDYKPSPYIQEGQKVAITTDTLSATSKVD